jgi:hypothetical protein
MDFIGGQEMAKYTQKEWLNELRNRFGKDTKNWAFVCPACGKVSTVQEFLDAGADVNDSYQSCIGRFTGKGSPKEGQDGCNWAAYGLFGTCGKGDTVISEDGKEIDVFAMAPKPHNEA